MFHALQQTDLTLPGKHNTPNQVCATTSRFPGKKTWVKNAYSAWKGLYGTLAPSS